MNELFRKLRELKSITTDNEIKNFILSNENDEEFMKVCMFIIDKLIVTGIDSKKWNKVETIQINEFDILRAINYITEISNTGRDEDIKFLKSLGRNVLSKEDYETYGEIMCKKFKLGIGVKSWNKIVDSKYKIVSPIYCGCVGYSKDRIEKLLKDDGYGILQTKEDGLFDTVFVINNNVYMKSRNGHTLKFYEYNFVKDVENLNKGIFSEYVLNGELLVKGVDRLTSNGIIARINKYNSETDAKKLNKIELDFLEEFGNPIQSYKDKVDYVVWDLIPYENYINEIDETPYEQRLENLNLVMDGVSTTNLRIVEGHIVTSMEDVNRIFSEHLSRGLEGCIYKSPKAIFKNTKSTMMIKLKMEMRFELEIVGMEEGEGRLKGTLGNLIAKSSCGTIVNGVTGFSDQLRADVWTNPKDYIGKIITVKCNGISKNKEGGIGLLFCTFQSIRDDKDRAETYEEILAIQNSILNLKESTNVQ